MGINFIDVPWFYAEYSQNGFENVIKFKWYLGIIKPKVFKISS